MSLKIIAKNLGLSITAVSRALNGHSDISEETRNIIKAEAERIGYQPNTNAQRLKKGKSDAVGLVYPYASSLSNDFFFAMVSAIGHQLAKKEVDFLLITDDQQEECQTFLRLIEGKRIDALIVAHTLEQDPRLALLQQKNVPFLALGRSQLPQPYAWFDFDNRLGLDIATEHLITLGHRRISLLSEDRQQAFIMQRRQGYRDALQRHALPCSPYLKTADVTRRAGYRATLELLALPEPPTAIITDGSVQGEGAVAALREVGRLSGPDAVALIVYDGLPEDCLTSVDATAIIQATREEVGNQIAQMTLALMAGEPVERIQMLWQPTLRQGTTTFPLKS
ncbi:substrate-binding domain-containing protein [Serratia plymuthica]|uniref:substrate-binding domain-containing protein n=1 Tax=Serratia plymuthica TaxID=82996 RepID=UPI0004567238|nr:substrate-binding domain-containing protein [Serratia plymuthica]AHY07485.1 transcriptional regulator [Serratia plymuthica]MBL3521759.1 substrate-binding domain-containing protein [Serratia plymuthica]MEB6538191.1 substrate-binding domain-containing protein [Serratia plymuthica]